MAETKPLEVTVGGKALSPDQAAKVHAALKQALSDTLAKQGVKGPVEKMGDVGSHARW
jgi:hypothetical protein